MSNVKTQISNEFFFHNGDLLLKSISIKNGVTLQKAINAWLNNDYVFEDSLHKDGRKGFTADSVNKQLRAKMKDCVPGIHGESFIEYGSIISVSKKGFDFCIYDEEYYTTKLRNSFIGYPGRYKGLDELKCFYTKIKKNNDVFYTKDEWKKKIQEIKCEPGKNLDIRKQSYTIAGEIQIGNWALVGHDFIRLLNSERDGEIDFYIYITADGNLKSKLSQQIVSYESAKDFFSENIQLIHTPIWLIGLDILT